MSDLCELIKRRQDELRGREEDWIDRLFSWWRGVDLVSLVILVAIIPQIVLLIAIEITILWKVISS